VDQRQAGHRTHGQTGTGDVDDARSDHQVDAESVQIPGQFADTLGAQVVGGGERDGVDVGLEDRVVHLARVTEDRELADAGNVDGAAGTAPRQAHTHDRVAVVPALGQGLNEAAHGPDVADRKDCDDAFAAAALPGEVVPAQVATQQQRGQSEREGHREVSAGVLGPEDHEGDGDDADGGQGRGDHAPVLLDAGADDPR
jgi:hypothetical protein